MTQYLIAGATEPGERKGVCALPIFGIENGFRNPFKISIGMVLEQFASLKFSSSHHPAFLKDEEKTKNCLDLRMDKVMIKLSPNAFFTQVAFRRS